MILKLSDLQRSLDVSLATTHGPVSLARAYVSITANVQTRIFVIVARYCADAVWQADLQDFRNTVQSTGVTLSSTAFIVRSFFSHLYWSTALGTAERYMDLRAQWVKINLWLKGWSKGGIAVAEEMSAGLEVA